MNTFFPGDISDLRPSKVSGFVPILKSMNSTLSFKKIRTKNIFSSWRKFILKNIFVFFSRKFWKIFSFFFSSKILIFFWQNQNFWKFSKKFEDQLWEDLTFFVFNRFWISFFIDRSEIPWRTRFFDPKVFKKHRKKVASAPVPNRQIPGSVSLFWGRPAAGQLPGSLIATKCSENRAYSGMYFTKLCFYRFLL